MGIYDEYLKFKDSQTKSLDDYIDSGKMSELQKNLIKQVMEENGVIIIVGKIQSGKSTLCNSINKEKFEKSLRLKPHKLRIDEWFSKDDEIKKGEDIIQLILRYNRSHSYNVMTLHLLDEGNIIKATLEKLEEYISENPNEYGAEKKLVFRKIFQMLRLIILMDSKESGKVKEIFKV